ncbi:MAG: ArnT family glycosyltransferase [Patescibacteria group bacterium]
MKRIFGFLYYFIFILLVSINIKFLFTGFFNNILDMQEFRQTHTAMATEYLMKGGFRLDYLVPVFGKPFSLPLEFPIYQVTVATISNILKLDMILAGRLVSILFYYLSLILIFFITKHFLKNTKRSLMVVSLFLVNPLYIFWSRTFMMESTVMFFSLLFLYSFLKLDSNIGVFMIGALLSGITSAVSKGTTFFLYFFASLFLFLSTEVKRILEQGINYLMKNRNSLLVRLFILSAGVFALVVWTIYAGSVRKNNPLADAILGGSTFYRWYFGTFMSRFSVDNWHQMYQIVLFNVNGNLVNGLMTVTFITALLLAIFLKLKHKKEILILLALFLLGPFVFTNLYVLHNYYYYANLVFLLMAIGFFISSLLESKKLSLITVGYLYYFFMISIMISGYRYYYYPFQKINQTKYLQLSSFVKQHTSKDDVLIMYGLDWRPVIPFYSKRAAIMDNQNFPIDNKVFLDTIRNTGKSNIGVMIVDKDFENKNKKFIEDRIKFFDFRDSPKSMENCNIYFKAAK